ncbi:MAG: T9SS type A sorting domain-containing protein, partial [bacterium]|nr:T9SS type A sorting domain-containing protein [bacterium]
DSDALNFQWFINNLPDTAAVDTFFTLVKSAIGFNHPDTVRCRISDWDSQIILEWLVFLNETQNRAPEIITVEPNPDSVIVVEDTTKFRVVCLDQDGDSLSYRWLLNRDTLDVNQPLYKLFLEADSLPGFDTLSVFISDGDTIIFVRWTILRMREQTTAIDTLKLGFFPESDLIVAELGDSLEFYILQLPDSVTVTWLVNGVVISSDSNAEFVFYPMVTKSDPDTVAAQWSVEDSIGFHSWYIHYPNTASIADSAFLQFFPEQDTLLMASDDSLQFLIRPSKAVISDYSFHWLVNQQLIPFANDSVLFYISNHDTVSVDTITALVAGSDTMIYRHWVVCFQPQQYLPIPQLLFPIGGETISEFDALIWANDSSLSSSDSIGTMRYVIQLSSDSTFSRIVCSDTCTAAEILLSSISGFNKIHTGEHLFWRVQCLSSTFRVSHFNKSSVPFSYSPEFSVIENFYGEQKSDGILLTWSVQYEGRSSGFNVYRSQYQNQDFERINEQLIHHAFLDETNFSGRTIYYQLEEISTSGRKKIHSTISVERQLPDDYQLQQNFPNPFNSQTSFKYQIPVDTQVIIEVYNILGKKVKTLVNANKEAGFYTVYWDGFDNKGEAVVSGIYFYQMNADKFHATHKMIVVR